jgi:glycine/D-amino acid oxidase-like deaminating enzyme
MPPSPTATTTAHDVVIIGGGIVGTSTAYLLGRAGVRSLLVERDAIGSHASMSSPTDWSWPLPEPPRTGGHGSATAVSSVSPVEAGV